jgi:arylsulfatase
MNQATTTRRSLIQSAAALTALPAIRSQAQSSRRPNILFIFPDQLRFDWTGANPEIGVRTPNLDLLAARGVRFTRAAVASPLCAPSRACLASGMEYERCGVPSNGTDFPLERQTYYRLLRDSGYHVTGCGKFDLAKKSNNQGVDGKLHLTDWGFTDGVNNAGKHDAMKGAKNPSDPYMAFLQRRNLSQTHVDDFAKRKGYDATFPTALPDDAYCDNWLAQNGMDLIKASPKGKPWHLVVNFTGPHSPMDITASMEKLVRGRNFPQPNRNTEYDAATHVRIRQNYSAMVENVDRWLGLYIEMLKSRGELDNTLIVFSSDHGEMLGDHNMWGKIKPLQASVGVPLVVAGPGVAKGVASGALVSVMDLAATYLDYAGAARPKAMDSRSLRAVLEGKTKRHRDHLLSGLDPWRMVNDGRYKLVRGFSMESGRKGKAAAGGGETELLFDMKNDPLENENLAKRMPAEVTRLAKVLNFPAKP